MPRQASPPRLKLPSRRRPRALISLTPLIDVVFILLVFFMLASSFMDWRAIRLDSPAQAGRSGTTTGAVLLRIQADGSLDLAGETLGLARLANRLQPLLAREPVPTILVRPAEGVPLQRAVEVLDAAGAAGAPKVRLIRGTP